VRLALLACVVLIAASCGGSVPAMRITRFSATPDYHFPVFDRSISDSTVSRPVFDALRSLPPAPSDRCPDPAYGLRYRLSFNEAGRVVLSVVIEGDGCDEVVFSEIDRRTPDDAFREILARALGVKKEDIFDVLPTEKRP
jgi:hypothetical protein